MGILHSRAEEYKWKISVDFKVLSFGQSYQFFEIFQERTNIHNSILSQFRVPHPIFLSKLNLPKNRPSLLLYFSLPSSLSLPPSTTTQQYTSMHPCLAAWLRIHYINQATLNLKLTKNSLSLPPKCWY